MILLSLNTRHVLLVRKILVEDVKHIRVGHVVHERHLLRVLILQSHRRHCWVQGSLRRLTAMTGRVDRKIIYLPANLRRGLSEHVIADMPCSSRRRALFSHLMQPPNRFLGGIKNIFSLFWHVSCAERQFQYQHSSSLYKIMKELPPWPNAVEASGVGLVRNQSQ